MNWVNYGDQKLGKVRLTMNWVKYSDNDLGKEQ